MLEPLAGDEHSIPQGSVEDIFKNFIEIINRVQSFYIKFSDESSQQFILKEEDIKK